MRRLMQALGIPGQGLSEKEVGAILNWYILENEGSGGLLMSFLKMNKNDLDYWLPSWTYTHCRERQYQWRRIW